MSERRAVNAYIIDEDYKIVYYNERIEELYPYIKEGDICYDVLCGESQPCKECPLGKSRAKSPLFYNRIMGNWMEVEVASVQWPERGNCHLFIAKVLEGNNKDILYNLLTDSAYDELYELNLSQNCGAVLYDSKRKRKLNLDKLTVNEMIIKAAEEQIHPEDKARYLEFVDPDKLISRLSVNEGGNADTILVRRKCDGSEYVWVVETIVALKSSEGYDKKLWCFIKEISEQESLDNYSDKIRISKYDRLTGLLERNHFYYKVEEMLQDASPAQFCMVAIDIEHFKLFNEWYGEDEGDRLLISISEYVKEIEKKYEGIAGRLGGDDFAILLPNDENVLLELQNNISYYIKSYSSNAGFLPCFGVCVTTGEEGAGTLYDRAVIAMSQIKGDYAQRIRWYDAEMTKRMEEDHQLLYEVQRAFNNNEFLFYCQPKCNMITGKIIGLESLARWNHPTRGIVSPAEFIPFLENNGFITKLDMYIWEQVCIETKRWLDEGNKPIPVSVNVSRVDMFVIDIPKHFKSLIEKYDIEPGLIEIEITESAFSEEYDMMRQVVEELRKSGFTVMIDDFGSGYSSLNMLKNINADVLKIDTKFLELDHGSMDRGVDILEAIVRMANLIELSIIVEGIETEEQKNLLLGMGCLYCQGYYYYRPMPIEDVRELLSEEGIIEEGNYHAEKVQRIRPGELMEYDFLNETMLNTIIGGMAFFKVRDDEIEFMRANNQYYRIMRTNPIELERNPRNPVEALLDGEREKMLQMFRQAKEQAPMEVEGETKRRRGDGVVIYLWLKVFFLREENGEDVFYVAMDDVTKVKEQEREVQIIEEKMESIFKLAEINSWEWDIAESTLSILEDTAIYVNAQNGRFEKQGPQLVTKNFPNNMWESDELSDKCKQRAKDFIEKIMRNDSDDTLTLEIPIPLKTGKEAWLKIVAKNYRDNTGKIKKVAGYYRDITIQKERNKKLTKMAEMDELTGLQNRRSGIQKIRNYLEKEQIESAALIMFDVDNFKLANDVFGHAFGDAMLIENAKKLGSFFRKDDIVCRLGGDEFLILCKTISREDVEIKLKQMMEEMETTYQREPHEVHFSVSAGYVMIPEQGETFDELYEKADIALFAAKMSGKSSYKRYDPAMKEVRYELAGIEG